MFDGRDDAGIGLAEIFDDTIHGGEDDEQVCGQKRGDEGGEFIVVAEFQFGEGDGVVFVDDGDDAMLEQGDEGVARVEMAFVALQIFVGEQHLGDVEIVFGEQRLVGGHEAGLADGGAGLLFGQFGGALFVAERAHAGADRAGGDEHDFAPGEALGRDLGDQLFHLGKVGLLPAVGEDTGAELDDDTTYVFEQLTSHEKLVAKDGGCVEKGWGEKDWETNYGRN
ncbi:MAG: Phosphoglucomutase/phosphomannomutase [Pedosphaera sp.]|nr:Phosphoglucomutase/phosphomannomutase [Pedosphaera sp.]